MSLDLIVQKPIDATAQAVTDQNGNPSALMVANNRVVINVTESGHFVVGNPNIATGGYTSLVISLTKSQGGAIQIQAIQSSGSHYGQLILNPSGGNVMLPGNLTISNLVPAPPGAVDLVVDPTTGRIYRQA